MHQNGREDLALRRSLTVEGLVDCRAHMTLVAVHEIRTFVGGVEVLVVAGASALALGRRSRGRSING